MGPTHKEKEKENKKIKIKTLNENRRLTEGCPKKNFFLVFLLLVLSYIFEFMSVRICRDKHGKCSTRRGLSVSTRNISPRIQVNTQKNLNF